MMKGNRLGLRQRGAQPALPAFRSRAEVAAHALPSSTQASRTSSPKQVLVGKCNLSKKQFPLENSKKSEKKPIKFTLRMVQQHESTCNSNTNGVLGLPIFQKNSPKINTTCLQSLIQADRSGMEDSKKILAGQQRSVFHRSPMLQRKISDIAERRCFRFTDKKIRAVQRSNSPVYTTKKPSEEIPTNQGKRWNYLIHTRKININGILKGIIQSELGKMLAKPHERNPSVSRAIPDSTKVVPQLQRSHQRASSESRRQERLEGRGRESTPKNANILNVFIQTKGTAPRNRSKDLSEEKTENRKPKFLLVDFLTQERENLIEQNRTYIRLHKVVPPTTLEHYKFVKLLGKGAFGKVTLGVHKLTGKYVAIKTIDKKYMKDDFSRNKVFQEVYILKKIRHANVIRLLEVFEGPKHILIVMEYASGGDLLRYVKRKGPLPEDEARSLFRQVVYGLGHIHSRSVLHRDIKLDNILLDSEGGVKICDFGVSKIISRQERIREQCGTPAYLAPEIITDEGYQGFYVDHWSLGVLLYAMLCAAVPFKAQNMHDLLQVILTTPVTFPILISELASDLILSLLRIEPTKRLSIPEMLRHPWLQYSPEQSLDDSSDCHLSYKECVNPEAKGKKPDMSIVNIGNLFFSEQGGERLSYSDFCYIENDLYTQHVEDEILKNMEKMAYPRELVIRGLQSGELNHATATYNLLVLP